MSKTLAMIALAIGIVAITAGSALAGAGCGGVTQTTQSVSLDAQTASTGGTLQQTPKPEDGSD